jgi:hypothetical protein
LRRTFLAAEGDAATFWYGESRSRSSFNANSS